jgi:hypothetical protein
MMKLMYALSSEAELLRCVDDAKFIKIHKGVMLANCSE